MDAPRSGECSIGGFGRCRRPARLRSANSSTNWSASATLRSRNSACTFAADRTPAVAHATAVELLVDAGATVIGKTITDELAYSLSGTNVHFGTPVNPAAPGRIPGGSSAGSASAVAAGLCDLALGTDTGGSIRVPASYCGILGWRPTHGAVSTRGVVHLARDTWLDRPVALCTLAC